MGSRTALCASARTADGSIRPSCNRNQSAQPASPTWRTLDSRGDGELSARLPSLEVTHRVSYVVQRVGSVDARRDLAGFDELGEPFEVAVVFLRDEHGQ